MLGTEPRPCADACRCQGLRTCCRRTICGGDGTSPCCPLACARSRKVDWTVRLRRPIRISHLNPPRIDGRLDNRLGRETLRRSTRVLAEDVPGANMSGPIQRTGLMGAMRPQTPHRSPRQAIRGNKREGAPRLRNRNDSWTPSNREDGFFSLTE